MNRDLGYVLDDLDKRNFEPIAIAKKIGKFEIEPGTFITCPFDQMEIEEGEIVAVRRRNDDWRYAKVTHKPSGRYFVGMVSFRPDNVWHSFAVYFKEEVLKLKKTIPVQSTPGDLQALNNEKSDSKTREYLLQLLHCCLRP